MKKCEYVCTSFVRLYFKHLNRKNFENQKRYTMHIGGTVYAMFRKKLNYSLSENGRAQIPLLKWHFLQKSVLYYSKLDK